MNRFNILYQVHDKESIIGIVSERYSKLSESETLLNAAKVFLSCCKQDEEIEKIAQTNGFSDLLGLDDGDLHQRKHICMKISSPFFLN